MLPVFVKRRATRSAVASAHILGRIGQIRKERDDTADAKIGMPLGEGGASTEADHHRASMDEYVTSDRQPAL